MGPIRKSAVLAGTAVAMVLVAAATAWACVPAGTPGTIKASPPRAEPGQQVRLTGLAGGSSPVSFYLASAGSAPIAELPVMKDAEGPGYNFDGMVTLPANAPTGYTILFANQDNVRWQVPFTLLAENDPVAAFEGAETEGSGGTSSGLIALALVVAGALVGIGAFALRRRASGAQPEMSEVASD